jgi:uncharacterized protein (TIGR01777 family)
MSQQHILITGGSGLIGNLLTDALLKKGFEVSHLSRKPKNDGRVKSYFWDVEHGEIDEECLDGVDTVVHLAGAGIAEKRWTAERKKELIESRTKSIGLIYQLIKTKPNSVKAIVSASATGYYSDRGDEVMKEENAPANDFLGTCCVDWENAVDEGLKLGLRIVKFRTGVVLHKDGGALPQLAMPAKWGIGSPIGNGKQWISWIHWQDVIDLYVDGIVNQHLSGAYNMVAPVAVTNAEMSKAVAKQLHKPFWAPNVPAFILKLLMGEMSSVVLGSTKVSAEKIISQGYTFKYPELAGALEEIYA